MIDPTDARWSFSLFINGGSQRSLMAVDTVRRLCDDELRGQVDLDVIDVHRQPARAATDRVVATPTLVRRAPLPVRRIVGDLSDINRIRIWLAICGQELRDHDDTDT